MWPLGVMSSLQSGRVDMYIRQLDCWGSLRHLEHCIGINLDPPQNVDLFDEFIKERRATSCAVWSIMDRLTIVHSSSAAAAVEKSWVSLNAEMTAGSVEDVGSILLTVSMLTKRRFTPWRLPKNEYTRCGHRLHPLQQRPRTVERLPVGECSGCSECLH